MWSDLTSVDFWKGLISGGIVLKSIQFLISRFVKKSDDKKSDLIKHIKTDITALESYLSPLLKDAMSYYSESTSAGEKLARTIRSELFQFASAVNRLNERLKIKDRIDLELVVSLRKAITLRMDVQRPDTLAISDPIIVQIHLAVVELKDALSHLKYSI